jgi:hypothetical protein
MLKEILLVVGGAAIGFTTGWFIRKYKDDAAAVKKELDFNTQYLELREKYYSALKILHTNGLDDELNKEDKNEKTGTTDQRIFNHNNCNRNCCGSSILFLNAKPSGSRKYFRLFHCYRKLYPSAGFRNYHDF